MENKTDISLPNGLNISGNHVTFHFAHFANVSSFSVRDDDLSKSRFEDNEELRYGTAIAISSVHLYNVFCVLTIR